MFWADSGAPGIMANIFVLSENNLKTFYYIGLVSSVAYKLGFLLLIPIEIASPSSLAVAFQVVRVPTPVADGIDPIRTECERT